MESKTLIGGFLAGTAVGIALGLLWTTASDETKEKIAEGAKKLAGKLKETALDTAKDLKDQYLGTTTSHQKK